MLQVSTKNQKVYIDKHTNIKNVYFINYYFIQH